MLHAKTSVADGRWGRVGSTNLNLASWVGNFELDVVVEDERFGAALQAMYLDDLNGSTELILGAEWTDRRITVHSSREPRGGRSDSDQGRRFRSAGRHASGVATGAVRLGNAVSAAIADRRTFAYAEDGIIGGAGLLLLVVAWIGVLWPRVLTIPMALLAAWLGAALLVKALSLHRQRPPRAR